MKLMKDINQLIAKKVIEIVLVFFFVVLATFLIYNDNTKELFGTISSFSNLNYTDFTIENPISYNMFPMSDEDAMNNLKPCLIHVMNNTYTLESYVLLLKINKNSTLDYHYLHIGIDNSIFKLDELKLEETAEDYLFILDEKSLVGELKNYEIRLWLNTLAGNDMQSKDLILSFDLVHKTTKM